MGDPETEVVMARLESDLISLCIAATQHELDQAQIRVDPRAAATIMAVSNGYPLGYNKGFEITGLDVDYGKQSLIFHAGTKEEDGKIVTNGGRVLCVTSLHNDLEEAVNTSLDILDHIQYEGISYRTDIGFEFVKR